jgi:hypothetical protein
MMGEDLAVFAFKDVGDVSLFKPYIRYYIQPFLSSFFYHCIAAAVTIDLGRPRTLEMMTGPCFATLVKQIGP